MNYIGKVFYNWVNPTPQEQDRGNIPILIYSKVFKDFDEALETVKNKAKQQSIAILKAKFNKYHRLPVCKYYVRIENSWEVAEGKAKQGKLYNEWVEKDYEYGELFICQ